MLKTNRGFWKWFFLSLITFGIYDFFFIHNMAKEANTVDEGGKKVGGLLAYILLSAITFGIYGLYWNYRICEKFGNSVRMNGGAPRITGGGWLLWDLVGALILVGPLVAFVKQVHLWNDANAAFNARHQAA